MTEYMEQVSDPDHARDFDYESQTKDFKKTFEVLSKTLAEQSFSRTNANRNDLQKKIIVYQFESFTLGLQKYLDKLDVSTIKACQELTNLFKQIKFNQDFITLTTGGGKNTPKALNERVSFVEDKIGEFLSNGH